MTHLRSALRRRAVCRTRLVALHDGCGLGSMHEEHELLHLPCDDTGHLAVNRESAMKMPLKIGEIHRDRISRGSDLLSSPRSRPKPWSTFSPVKQTRLWPQGRRSSGGSRRPCWSLLLSYMMIIYLDAGIASRVVKSPGLFSRRARASQN